MVPTEMVTDTKAKEKKKFRVIHNHELCKGCGLCMAYCPTGRIEADILGKAQFPEETRDKCTGCKRCVWFCPDFANWVEEDDSEEEDGREQAGENSSKKGLE